jgi:hypothetical protein
MTLIEKIRIIYPSLKDEDFLGFNATIHLQNDGGDDYIKSWTNVNPQPTEQQLQEVGT